MPRTKGKTENKRLTELEQRMSQMTGQLTSLSKTTIAETPSTIDLFLDFIERVPLDEKEKLQEKDNNLMAATNRLERATGLALAAGEFGQLHLNLAFDGIREALRIIEAILKELKQRQ